MKELGFGRKEGDVEMKELSVGRRRREGEGSLRSEELEKERYICGCREEAVLKRKAGVREDERLCIQIVDRAM